MKPNVRAGDPQESTVRSARTCRQARRIALGQLLIDASACNLGCVFIAAITSVITLHFVIRGSYDEVLHRPFESIEDIPAAFRAEVAFVGTWIRGEGRDEFLLALIDRGLDSAIWDDLWQKSPNRSRLRAHWRGPGLAGRDDVVAIQGAKLALGVLLSGSNRNLHTRQSVETPYAGGLLCAEKTTRHRAMYRGGGDPLGDASSDDPGSSGQSIAIPADPAEQSA